MSCLETDGSPGLDRLTMYGGSANMGRFYT